MQGDEACSGPDDKAPDAPWAAQASPASDEHEEAEARDDSAWNYAHRNNNLPEEERTLPALPKLCRPVR